MGSRRGGDVARGDDLADDEGAIGETINEGSGSPSRLATLSREVVGAFGEGGGGGVVWVERGSLDELRGEPDPVVFLEWWLISRIKEPPLSMSSGWESKSREAGTISS
jgi:hypothetical protein